MFKKFFTKKNNGFSIIEAIVGIFLFVTAFYALYGVLSFSFALISQNKMALGARALADEQMEYLRSLPFNSVGVVAGNPSGAIPATESITLNGVQYTRRNVIFWVDDPKDGLATDVSPDTISTDYKQAKIEVTWSFRGTAKSFFTVTNITPKGMETNAPGGIFKITVADASTSPVQGANINIKNTATGLDVNRLTPSSGIWYEYGLPPGTGYEITVTKAGYNSSQTYSTSTVTNPDPGHLTSIDDTVNPKVFFIDKVSGETVVLYNVPAENTWSDSFADASKLSSMASTTVSAGALVLTDNLGVYDLNGSATSTWVTPADIYRWTEVSWSATKPAGTNLFYQVYYDNLGTATLVPDSKIPGNSTGILASPINLEGLNDQSFGRTGNTRIKISVTESTTDTTFTPALLNWTVKYDVHVPHANFTFNMIGMTKLIGTDAGLSPVYKFNQNPITDSSGVMATTSLEYDTYTVSRTGYDIAESCPAQPQYIAPDTFSSVFIDMTASNPEAILIQVKDTAGADVPGAHVRLYRAAPAFDETKTAGLRCGQAFWNGLSVGTIVGGDPYSIDVSIPPYTSTTTITDLVDVSGYSTFTATAN